MRYCLRFIVPATGMPCRVINGRIFDSMDDAMAHTGIPAAEWQQCGLLSWHTEGWVIDAF